MFSSVCKAPSSGYASCTNFLSSFVRSLVSTYARSSTNRERERAGERFASFFFVNSFPLYTALLAAMNSSNGNTLTRFPGCGWLPAKQKRLLPPTPAQSSSSFLCMCVYVIARKITRLTLSVSFSFAFYRIKSVRVTPTAREETAKVTARERERRTLPRLPPLRKQGARIWLNFRSCVQCTKRSKTFLRSKIAHLSHRSLTHRQRVSSPVVRAKQYTLYTTHT